MTLVTAWAFTEADLRAAAGERSFERGLTYVDAVTDLSAAGPQVVGTVTGTRDYLVILTVSSGNDAGKGAGAGLRGHCTCPYGQEGFFCKHCVAVGLTVLRNAATVPAPRAAVPVGEARGGGRGGGQGSGRRRAGKRARAGTLQAWLRSQSRDDLLALVLDQVIEDDDWRRRLELRAAGAARNLTAVSARIDDLLAAGDLGQYGYIEGGDGWRYARRVREAADLVLTLVRAGDSRGAIAVAEHAIVAVARACRQADDQAGLISDAAAELAASHRAACLDAPADPVRLADFLAERMLGDDDPFDFDPWHYRDILGSAGLGRLRERLTAAWLGNPSGWIEQHALEQVLRAQGDVDALVAVLAANLDAYGRSHLRIARELERAGRADESLAWAQRGLREARQPDAVLADFVLQRYEALGRDADALAVRRDQLTAAPSVAAYQRLRDAAERAGDWPATRQWALDLLRQSRRETRQVLVDVLIADGDVPAAWESARGVASEAQWLRLADLVAETRPADALAVYLRQVESLRQQTGDGAYERMARLLAGASACHDRLGTQAAFRAYLRALRADQKRKQKLIAVLDARGLR